MEGDIEVVSYSFKRVVGALLDCEDEVPFGEVWDLFGFSFEDDGVACSHSFFYIELQVLVIIHYSLALAVGALGSHCLTFALALRAVLLHLHLHSKSDLHVLHDHTSATTLRALLQLAVLGTGPSALMAVDIAIDVHASLSSCVQLFQAYRYIRPCVRPFLDVALTPKSQVGQNTKILTIRTFRDHLLPHCHKLSVCHHPTELRRPD